MAVKFEFIDNRNRAMLSFKAMQKLEFKKDNQLDMVRYGKDNLYPQELIRLYDEHPEHRAIINRKARYIWGKGLKAKNKEQELKVEQFINSFNLKNDLNKIGKKIALNTETFNGCFFEIITDLNGKVNEIYVLNSAFCRLSECGEYLYFSKNWKRYTTEFKTIKRFENNGLAGTFFEKFSYESLSKDALSNVYPTPQYQSIVNDINTDVDISTFNSNYVSNGFSVGTIITFFNGTPPPETIEKLDRGLKGTYSGENGESVMINHQDSGSEAPSVIDTTIGDLSQKFEFTSKRAQKKIFAGHEMASELFNIKFDDSFLTGSPDLITLQELFVKGYVEPRQNDLLEFISYLSFLKTGEYLEFEFEPISLIGVDLSNDVDLTQDERRKLKGYEPLTAPKLDVNGAPLPVQANEVNDNLKGLTESENRDMQRVVRDFQAGKNGMNEHLAIARLTSYGLGVDEAKKILGINAEPNIKLSSQVDKVLMALEACAEDDNEDETILVEAAHIHNSKDALKYERQIMKFADALIVSVEVLDSAVLNALKANPTLTIDDLVAELNYDFAKIEESLVRLTTKGLVNNTATGFLVTDKGLSTETKPIINKEVYTVYKYAVNNEKPSLKKGGSSRPFCKKLTALSLNKSWTFEKLDAMENDLGTNVWDYRGGYYTNPDTGIVDPDCRHIWNAITKVRNKK